MIISKDLKASSMKGHGTRMSPPTLQTPPQVRVFSSLLGESNTRRFCGASPSLPGQCCFVGFVHAVYCTVSLVIFGGEIAFGAYHVDRFVLLWPPTSIRMECRALILNGCEKHLVYGRASNRSKRQKHGTRLNRRVETASLSMESGCPVLEEEERELRETREYLERRCAELM